MFDVTVGSALLKNAPVTIDFKGMQMWMEQLAGDTPENVKYPPDFVSYNEPQTFQGWLPDSKAISHGD